MILYFVLVGFVTGSIGAGFVLYTGGGVVLALLAYSLCGAFGVVLTALFVAFAPTMPRPRPRGGLPVTTHPVRAHHATIRPVRTRHMRMAAQARRR